MLSAENGMLARRGASYAVAHAETEQRPIFAAGGILRRLAIGGPEIVVIHRPRYDDWSLPKGKLKKGEAWETAALREVREETGYHAIITSFAGPITYHVDGRPKVVLFWNMRVDRDSSFRPTKEVDVFEWLPPAAACARLNYAVERRLVADLFPDEV
jgi:8-oxo-dGTP diphosphatase